MTAHTNQKPGCLSLFFPLLGRKTTKTVLITSSASSPEVPVPTVEKIIPEVLPYRLRDDFLSRAEFSFYKVLSSLSGTQFVIQSKVRLADIFFVARPNENVTYFNRIAQKHLDFLVCDSITMKPLLGIELDDSSHNRDSRQERDDFVEKVFQAAELPLLRLPVQREYNTRDVAAKIAPFLKNTVGESPALPLSENAKQVSSTPLCPKCGLPMVLRTVGQGENKGKQFYGCQNFPRCSEMKPLPL
jgi:very-short-patch-repair endonuclease